MNMSYIADFYDMIFSIFECGLNAFDFLFSNYWIFALPFVVGLAAFLVYEIIHLILKQVYT